MAVKAFNSSEMMSDFDRENISAIIVAGRLQHGGRYDWTNAYVLQYLDRMLAKVSWEHQAALYKLYPAQCRAVLEYWGWQPGIIDERINQWERD